MNNRSQVFFLFFVRILTFREVLNHNFRNDNKGSDIFSD